MIPSRGLRWSSQTLGVGRRRLETFSTRQFSSSTVQHGQFRPSPLLTNNGASAARIYTVSQFSKSKLLIRNVTAVRFASTAPVSSPIASASTASPIAPASATPPIESAASSASSIPEYITSSIDSASEFTSDGILGVPEQIGYLKSIGLDYGWGPTAVMEWTLEHIHVLAGTPWWASIILTTLAIRLVMMKFYMGASDNAARMSYIRPLTEPINKEMRVAQQARDTTKMLQMRQELQLVHKRAGIKMWKSFVPMITMFTGYGSWVLLRGMADLPVPGLETGGILWFPNLTLPDTALPICTALVLHWVIRKGGEMGTNNAATPGMLAFMKYGLPAMTFLFTYWLPAAVQLSFFATGVLSYIQGVLFKNAAFRDRFNLYPLNTTAPTPPTPGGPTPSPYKGVINVKGRTLTQEEINQTYTKPSATQTSEFQAGKESLRNKKSPKGTLNTIVGGAVKDIKGTVSSIKESGKGIVGMSKEKMKERQEKADRQSADAYEKKRQTELRRRSEELDEQRFLERQERKARRDAGR